MLNSLPIQSEARRPRGVVRINGEPTAAWVSWECSQNTFYEADTFRVTLAASAMTPAALLALTTQTEVFIEILAGLEGEPQSLIYGRADEIDHDPIQRLVTIAGRDLTAAFIDARVDDDWSNQTAGAIATAMAMNHGLLPVVTATKTKVGTYYKHDQVRMQTGQSEWDLLAWLAREEGFLCYVSGRELHFEPSTTAGEPYVIDWRDPDDTSGSPQCNAMSLGFTRALTVSKGVTVTVRSPSTTKKTAVVASYPSKPKAIQAGKSSPFGAMQTYHFTTTANKSPQDVEREAVARYNEIIAHEMKMHATLPGDNLLTVRARLRVQGTGTAFDQDYYPTDITRSMSMDQGYTMTVAAKNHSPQLQAAAV